MKNVVFIFSDSHTSDFCGCYGGITRTPNLDSIAKNGAVFKNMYSNCPLCVPARASMITSRYVHEIGTWENCSPYDGKVPGWGHYFKEKGTHFATVGKLDFGPEAETGIAEEMIPRKRKSLDVTGLFREPLSQFNDRDIYEKEWGARPRKDTMVRGEDCSNEAITWLKEKRPQDKPWVLYVNYGAPHSPWKAPDDLYPYYLEKLGEVSGKYVQPFEVLDEVDRARSFFSGGYLGDEEKIRKFHAAYHATIEELDQEIGRVLNTLDELGLRDDTMIVYASDHGEMGRAHGIWGKCSLYEDSAKVPLLMCGAGIPEGMVIEDPVSLIDVFPTINEAVGNDPAVFSRGRSLLNLARTGINSDGIDYAFSECHATGVIAGSFMIRKGDWKLIERVGYVPQLFNLKEDPQEMDNLALKVDTSPLASAKLEELQRILNSICSPEGVDAQARRDQQLLKMKLAETGRLEVELNKRGYRLENGHMVQKD